jgi:hypothetical protein
VSCSNWKYVGELESEAKQAELHKDQTLLNENWAQQALLDTIHSRTRNQSGSWKKSLRIGTLRDKEGGGKHRAGNVRGPSEVMENGPAAGLSLTRTTTEGNERAGESAPGDTSKYQRGGRSKSEARTLFGASGRNQSRPK